MSKKETNVVEKTQSIDFSAFNNLYNQDSIALRLLDLHYLICKISRESYKKTGQHCTSLTTSTLVFNEVINRMERVARITGEPNKGNLQLGTLSVTISDDEKNEFSILMKTVGSVNGGHFHELKFEKRIELKNL